jgi:hypothetical protein
MATNPQQELIWQGRLQLGDEPGVYADAYYSGLCAELPLTVYRLDPQQTEGKPFVLVLETEDLQTYTNYPGHEILVLLYEPDPNQAYHSIETQLASARFIGADNNRKEIEINPGVAPSPFRISVRLRSDTTVNPGLYDDFVWIRLSLKATGADIVYYASLGFPN